MKFSIALAALVLSLTGCASSPRNVAADSALRAEPLVIGRTLTFESRVMSETRRINIMVPTMYGEPIDGPMPVLIVLDGGMNEDFLHIAGLVQVLTCNGGMKPHIVVGVPNTVRRRDLTGPTTNPEDLRIAPVVGGSATFRRFLKDEVMPLVAGAQRTTDESAIIGESLAGLFVLETLVAEPDLFDTYVAIDPSLWWADGSLVEAAKARLPQTKPRARVFIAASGDAAMLKQASEFAAVLRSVPTIVLRESPMPEETHGTIYHPAALAGLRSLLGQEPK